MLKRILRIFIFEHHLKMASSEYPSLFTEDPFSPYSLLVTWYCQDTSNPTIKMRISVLPILGWFFKKLRWQRNFLVESRSIQNGPGPRLKWFATQQSASLRVMFRVGPWRKNKKSPKMPPSWSLRASGFQHVCPFVLTHVLVFFKFQPYFLPMDVWVWTYIFDNIPRNIQWHDFKHPAFPPHGISPSLIQVSSAAISWWRQDPWRENSRCPRVPKKKRSPGTGLRPRKTMLEA